MKHAMVRLIVAVGLLCAPACAHPATDQDWVGIWHADVDGQPTGTLTLATDTGQLGGTIVLDIVSREGGKAHVIASEPHLLVSPRVAGDTLTFAVKLRRPNGTVTAATFVVTRGQPDQVKIHCVSCGPDAPTVELVRDPSQTNF